MTRKLRDCKQCLKNKHCKRCRCCKSTEPSGMLRTRNGVQQDQRIRGALQGIGERLRDQYGTLER